MDWVCFEFMGIDFVGMGRWFGCGDCLLRFARLGIVEDVDVDVTVAVAVAVCLGLVDW